MKDINDMGYIRNTNDFNLVHNKIPRLIFDEPVQLLKELARNAKIFMHHFSKISLSNKYITTIATRIDEILNKNEILSFDEIFSNQFDHDDKCSIISLALKELNKCVDSEDSPVIFLENEGCIFGTALITIFTQKMLEKFKDITRKVYATP
ncbi:hypothetical protein HZS_869 [Henneguya salminicola]|nr:hypothetical protein HZS_869 [Henneguya salminicola]